MAEVKYRDLDEVINLLSELNRNTLLSVQLSGAIGRTKRILTDRRIDRQELYNQVVENFGIANGEGEKQLMQGRAGWTAGQNRLKEIESMVVEVDLKLPREELDKEYTKKPFNGYADILSGLHMFIVEPSENGNETK